MSGQDKRAAIVCSHVAMDSLPILRAVRDEPEMAVDSGWQFLCGADHNDDPAMAKVWAICEVIEFDPSLSEFIDSPPGTVLTRRDRTENWVIGRKY